MPGETEPVVKLNYPSRREAIKWVQLSQAADCSSSWRTLQPIGEWQIEKLGAEVLGAEEVPQ